jgi:hypothetical protein
MGIQSKAVRTQQEVADILGIPRQNVSVIESRAIKKIREAFLADSDLVEPPERFVRCSGYRRNGKRVLFRKAGG